MSNTLSPNMVDRERLCFRLSAYNELAGVDDKFVLFYFIRNDERVDIEIMELKHRRKHLARIAFPHLKAVDIRPGAKVVIFGRQYIVEGYEDKHTSDTLGKSQQSSVALITASGLPVFGRVWASAEASGLRVLGARMVVLGEGDVAWASQHTAPSSSAGSLRAGGAVLALQLMGEDSDSKLGALVSHLESQGMPRGSVVVSGSGSGAAQELTGGFFGSPSARRPCTKEVNTAPSNSTCVLVLPHALVAGAAGTILADFSAALDSAAAAGAAPLNITACRILDLSRGQSEEFLEVYKGVVPEYPDMVNEYSSGPLVALEVCGEDAVAQVRKICGPRDVDVARRIRVDTLRAKHGVAASAGGPGGRAKLALHCTDLEEDGPLECEYVFSLTN